MTWIDDASAGAERANRNNQLIRQEAETVFNDLWNEIKKNIEELKRKKIDVWSNGSPYNRKLAIPVPPSPRRASSDPREMHIKLEKEKGKILAHGGGVDISLRLDVGKDDDVVRLTHDAHPVSIAEAAQLILQPFVFPETNTKD